MSDLLSIDQVLAALRAEAPWVGVTFIRYWEAELAIRPVRRSDGHILYTSADVAALRERAQST